MYNKKFILKDGTELYPGYADNEKRQLIKDQSGDQKEIMICGCNPEAKLWYGISSDLRIYPLHNGYEHKQDCNRYRNPETGKFERRTAYVSDDETGEVVAFLSFNPKLCNLKTEEEEIELPEEIEEEETEIPEEEELLIEKENKEKKEEFKAPELSLDGLIKSINYDTFSERVLNNSSIQSREAFSKQVFYRMKKVRLNKTKKNIGDLTLENDKVRFFYLPIDDIFGEEKFGKMKYYIQTKGKDGKPYRMLIFKDTLEKELKRYQKAYDKRPDKNTMIAGFQYLKKKKNYTYRFLGRIHLFETSKNGIYCNSIKEKETFNSLLEICQDKNIKFWIPPESSDDIGTVISVKGYKKKILLFFAKDANQIVNFDNTQYAALIIDRTIDITKELIYEALDENMEETEAII